MAQMQKNPETQKLQKKQRKNITQISSFLRNRKKTETEIFAFFVITYEPIRI